MPQIHRVVLALAVAACLPACANFVTTDVTWKPSGLFVACTLSPVTGTLVEVDGRTAIVGPKLHGPLPDPLFVRWPDGWQVRSTFGGLEVFDETWTFQARTGAAVSVYAAAGAPESPGSPIIAEGALLACPDLTFGGG